MKARDRVQDAAETLKPYVERAMGDERLRSDLLRAFGTAREVYSDLIGEKSPVTLANRVATDDEIRDKLRDAIADLRHASDRLQGRDERGRGRRGRGKTLLVAGIALGILFNPVTGAETRRFIKDMVSSGDDSSSSSANGSRN